MTSAILSGTLLALRSLVLFLPVYLFLQGKNRKIFTAGAALSLLAGAVGLLAGEAAVREIWGWFLLAQSVLLVFLIWRSPAIYEKERFWLVLAVVLFAGPFFVFFYSIKERAALESSPLAGVAGAVSAVAAFGLLLYISKKSVSAGLPLKKVFDPRSLAVTVSGFNLILPAVGEFPGLPFIAAARTAVREAMGGAVKAASDYLLLPQGHRFITAAPDGFSRFLAGEEFALLVVAVVLLMPPLAAAMALMLAPEPDTGEIKVKAKRRELLSTFRTDVLVRAFPLVSIIFINAMALHAANMSLNPLYEPPPVVLAAAEEILKVPLADSSGDVSDGRMRKYAVETGGGEKIIFIVMMRPDGEIKTALDACEICAPRGYGQQGDVLICKYCRTPVAVSTLGVPGGCNPIPFPSEAQGNFLLVRLSELLQAAREAGSKLGEGH